MAETLRPCPFCGGVAGVDKTNYYFEDTGEHAMSAFVVQCRSCGMKTAQYRTEDSAIKRWNRRAERTCRMVNCGSNDTCVVNHELSNGNIVSMEFARRLADLIEPGEPKAKYVAEVKVDVELLEKLAHDAAVELTGIDRDALLALADEMRGYADGAASGDGFPYVNAGSLWSYADRIREACGVEP